MVDWEHEHIHPRSPKPKYFIFNKIKLSAAVNQT